MSGKTPLMPVQGRSPFVVCRVWYKHPKEGRFFTVGTELLPTENPEQGVREQDKDSPQPAPDEIFVRSTAIYD